MAGRLINEVRSGAIMLGTLRLTAASPDPDDDYLLAMAVAGSADFVVTGDTRDLLPLSPYLGTKIVTVRGYLTLQGQLPE